VRIAIATDWFAPRRGGIESQLLELASRLGARGHDVDVITSTPGAVSGEGFRVVPVDVFRLPFADVAISPALVPVLARAMQGRYDVVHAHVSVVSPLGYAAAVIARSLLLPTVLTFHSVLRAKQYLLRAANGVARISEGGVEWSAVSALVASQARGALGVDVSVLPNAVDVAAWRRVQRGPRDAGQPVTLGSTMRLHRKKRPIALVRAFLAASRRAATPPRLILVGDGPERASLESEVAGHRDRIDLLGWRERGELLELYGRADGFVLASERESFGIAALEAMAAGLPVIAMAASGSREFLEHDVNALVCADDEDLARQLGRFIADPALRARLVPSPASVEPYDWSVVLEKHEDIYERAIARAAATRTVAATA